MRLFALALAALVVSSVPIPSGSAGTGPLLTDEKGDTTFDTGAPGAAPAPFSAAGQTDAADLLSLDIVEEDDYFTLVLTVAGLNTNIGSAYAIDFTWKDSEYRVMAQRFQSAVSNFQSATLLLSNGEGEFDRIASLRLTPDVTKGTLSVPVPKVYVLDTGRHLPTRGDTLTDIRVTASANLFRFGIFGDSSTGIHDAMPNTDDAASFTFTRGDLAQGHLALRTGDRIRVSNGGSTTFVFQAILHSNASYEDEVDLAIADAPEEWNGTIQTPVKVPPEGEHAITVLMSVPFAHEHGGFDSFNVTAVSKKDPDSKATVRFGVLHTPIPQPAGHHSELYLHALSGNSGPFATAFPFTYGFFNTDSTHEGEAEGVSANSFNNGPGWSLPLNPGLRMGLDFDIERMGELTGTIMSRANGEGTVTAKLFLIRERSQQNQSQNAQNDNGIVLATAKAVPVKWDLNTPTAFKLTLVPSEDANYIAYRPGQNLVLVIRSTSDMPCCFGFGGQTSPTLSTKDFKLTLPLNEYHDQLTGISEIASALDLRAIGEVEKLGRPGSVMTYAFDLVNGGREAVIELDVAGNDAKAGTLVPGGRVTLDAGETRRVTLAVRIPGTAAPGAELEVLVFAHAQDDPSKMAIARTKTMVSTGADAADDETEVLLAAREAEKKSPGPGVLVAVGAAALLAIALRARRRS